VRLVTPSFSYVASIYWKHASITSLLNLPLVGIQTFHEGALILPDFGQVDSYSRNNNALSSL
jgi:C4-dicarboxylate-specific signal transduction histidine kinase